MVEIELDSLTGVLYAEVPGKTWYTHCAETDTQLIIGQNEQGEIIRVILLDAESLTKTEWLNHPDRDQIPKEMLKAIDSWTGWRPE